MPGEFVGLGLQPGLPRAVLPNLILNVVGMIACLHDAIYQMLSCFNFQVRRRMATLVLYRRPRALGSAAHITAL